MYCFAVFLCLKFKKPSCTLESNLNVDGLQLAFPISKRDSRVKVKYYPQDWEEANLIEFFSQCGPVTAAAVKIDDKGRKFAFAPWHNEVSEFESKQPQNVSCQSWGHVFYHGFMSIPGALFMSDSRWTTRTLMMPRNVSTSCMAWILGWFRRNEGRWRAPQAFQEDLQYLFLLDSSEIMEQIDLIWYGIIQSLYLHGSSFVLTSRKSTIAIVFGVQMLQLWPMRKRINLCMSLVVRSSCQLFCCASWRRLASTSHLNVRTFEKTRRQKKSWVLMGIQCLGTMSLCHGVTFSQLLFLIWECSCRKSQTV